MPVTYSECAVPFINYDNVISYLNVAPLPVM